MTKEILYVVTVGTRCSLAPFDSLDDALEEAQSLREYADDEGPDFNPDEDAPMNPLSIFKGEFLELDRSSPDKITLR